MRKLLGAACVILLVLGIACSKDTQPINPIDPVVSLLAGKWSFHSSVGLNVTSDAMSSSLLADTLIFSSDNRYIVIKDKDTVDQGDFSLGADEAINGFGTMQIYDSIVYKSDSYLADPVYPLTVYFKVIKDTLSCRSAYYRDSAEDKVLVNYVRSE